MRRTTPPLRCPRLNEPQSRRTTEHNDEQTRQSRSGRETASSWHVDGDPRDTDTFA
jgi:uncharacterized protein (DUF3084 family)